MVNGFQGTTAGTVFGRTPSLASAPPTSSALWTSARAGADHLAGVAHNVRFTTDTDTAGYNLDTWGYGVIGDVTFNLPMLSAGSKIAFQGAYAHGAIGYSGVGSPAWG